MNDRIANELGRTVPAVLVLAGLATAAFQPFWNREYAFADDYVGLVQFVEPTARGAASRLIIRDGRILFGLAFDSLYASVGSIKYLWLPRLVSGVGVLVLAILIQRMLRKLGERRVDATIVAG